MRCLDNCPSRKIAPWLGLGFGLGLALELGLGDNFPRGQLSWNPKLHKHNILKKPFHKKVN